MNKMDVFDKMEFVKEVLGAEEAFDELCRAIGMWEAEEMLNYIINLHELTKDNDEENED